jgi:co-chaperonin GroES (HSP10)
MNLQPLGDRLIVEVLEEEATPSGIVLPDTARRSRSAAVSSPLAPASAASRAAIGS